MKEEECPFITIYDWMHTLNLSGRELLVYALVHGFNRPENECFGYGYKQRIAERLRMHPSGVSRALSVLKRMGLIKESFWEDGGSTLEADFDGSGPFISVYDWMLSLDLPGRELLVFALVYGFNRDGKECYGRREWISRRLNISNPSKVIASLKAKGLIWEKRNPDKSSVLIASPVKN